MANFTGDPDPGDSYSGTPESDTIRGLGGDDGLSGGDGDDLIFGGADDDAVSGQNGADTLYGDSGDDVVSGGAGADLCIGGAGDDALFGNEGADTLRGGAGDDRFGVVSEDGLADRRFGEAGDDEFTVSDPAVLVRGLLLSGGAGRDTVLCVGPLDFNFNLARASLSGIENINAYEATLTTAQLNSIPLVSVANPVRPDLVSAITHLNVANAGSVDMSGRGNVGVSTFHLHKGGNSLDLKGDHRFDGSQGGFVVAGGKSDDTVVGSLDGDTLNGGKGADDLDGDAGDDVLSGGGGADSLSGGAGEDTIYGDANRDTLAGDAGDDVYVLVSANAFVSERSGQGEDLVRSEVTYRLTANVENLLLTFGGAIDGTGNALDNEITGTTGANRIDGGRGADRLRGDFVADEDDPNPTFGKDVFVFRDRIDAKEVDVILDFSTKDDTIELDRRIFVDLKRGVLSEDAFIVGAKATDEDHRIIYDDKTGRLYFDRDGSETGFRQQLFARLIENGTTDGKPEDVTFRDFLIV